MSHLTPKKTAKLETAVLNGSLTTVKQILQGVKEVPKQLVKTANAAFSNARKAGESEDLLRRRQEIENALKNKRSILGKTLNFLGMHGGRRTRRHRQKARKNTRKS